MELNASFCLAALLIYVNEPVITPEASYIPTTGTISSTQQVKNRRSIPLSKQVGSHVSTPNTETLSDLSFDYASPTRFNYDETTNKIGVFDGNRWTGG